MTRVLQAGRKEPLSGTTRSVVVFLHGYGADAADLIGLGNPFFRVHETRAGATTWIDGRSFTNFSSYDYLGLNGHPRINEAARTAIDAFGTSASASRIVAGERGCTVAGSAVPVT